MHACSLRRGWTFWTAACRQTRHPVRFVLRRFLFDETPISGFLGVVTAVGVVGLWHRAGGRSGFRASMSAVKNGPAIPPPDVHGPQRHLGLSHDYAARASSELAGKKRSATRNRPTSKRNRSGTQSGSPDGAGTDADVARAYTISGGTSARRSSKSNPLVVDPGTANSAQTPEVRSGRSWRGMQRPAPDRKTGICGRAASRARCTGCPVRTTTTCRSSRRREAWRSNRR